MNEVVDLVIVNDVDEVMDIVRFTDDGFPFDDNGGTPDGSAWIVEPGDLGKALSPVIERGLGRIMRGVSVSDYHGTDEQCTRLNEQFSQWCGYSSRAIAYGICQNGVC